MRELAKINHGDFMKKKFRESVLLETAVAPYASTERHMQQVLLFSDKVNQPTEYLYRRRKQALILPYSENIGAVVRQYFREVQYHIGVCSPYVTIRDFNGKLLATVSG